MSAYQSVEDINWQELRNKSFWPSPEAWQDQVMYFLLIDRFSNAQESPENQFRPDQIDSAIQNEEEAAHWRDAGYTYCGGTLKGIQSKLSYLQTLGITTIWLSPILQQVPTDSTSYHGYGAQNFLSVDPHFGTEENFRELVEQAHAIGMYVVLDIVVNHAGNVFAYDVPTNSETEPTFNQDGTYPVRGYYSKSGVVDIPYGRVDVERFTEVWPSGAIWPEELQRIETFNRRGCINDWEDPDQYLHGDFKFLKDINMGSGEGKDFRPSSALQALTRVYQYWLAYADLDGFRLDAVKHMGKPAVKYFTQEIKSFADSLGKQNFYIFGEIPGGEQQASETMAATGVDAALALLDMPSALEMMIKGFVSPWEYFRHFAPDLALDSQTNSEITWDKDKIVLFLDDHDQIRKNFDKARFPAGSPEWQVLAFSALATLLCSAGIPCLYYGCEQGFDGQGRHDRYIRETMFASDFGAFRSRDCHFFNQEHPIYQQLQRLMAVRKQSIALRRGAQQLLQISGDGQNFGFPEKIGEKVCSIVPWLRRTDEQTVLCVVSTDAWQEQSAWILLPSGVSSESQQLECLFSTDLQLAGQMLPIENIAFGRRVKVSLPPASLALFQF